METRNCLNCGPLPIEEFGWKSQPKKLYKAHCKKCDRAYNNKWHSENKARRNASVKENVKRCLTSKKQKLYDLLKTLSCESCTEKDPVVLQFHHIDPSTKDNEVAQMVLNGCSWTKIEKEIAKCKVLCANCHIKLTAKQFNYFRSKAGCPGKS